MGNYRTTVILKTDMVDSTPRLAEQTQMEMGLQRKQHRQFISEIAIKHQGSVFQEEGDAYLIEFPSVTDAVLAAIEMHQSLRNTQLGKSDKQRLAIRAMITVGDVLQQETDLIGTTMSLIARIEKVTPPDEIYLSHAAWLVLNKAEVQTSFVNEFQFKGFNEVEKVYKVSQKHGIRVLTDQCIVFADAKGFSKFVKNNKSEMVEEFLLKYDDLMNGVCVKHQGTIRQVNGDLYFLTFSTANQAVTAMKMLCHEWREIFDKFKIGIAVGIHKGNFSIFRSYVFGDDINTTVDLSELCRSYTSDEDQIFVIVSHRIRDEFTEAEQEAKFQKMDIDLTTPDLIESIREHGAYRLIVE